MPFMFNLLDKPYGGVVNRKCTAIIMFLIIICDKLGRPPVIAQFFAYEKIGITGGIHVTTLIILANIFTALR